MRSDLILKEARQFEKFSAFDFGKIIQSFRNAITIELNAGKAAVDKLYGSNPKASGSRGLKAVSDTFVKVRASINELAPDNASVEIENMIRAVGQAMFYSSPQNSGTGYEPITTVGGAASPGGVLVRIKSYLEKLKKYSDYNEKLQTPAPVPVAPKPVTEQAPMEIAQNSEPLEVSRG